MIQQQTWLLAAWHSTIVQDTPLLGSYWQNRPIAAGFCFLNGRSILSTL
jgi:hypothetical protein